MEATLMMKRLLAVLFVSISVIALIIPFASPVMADAPPTLTYLDSDYSPWAVPGGSDSVVFYGTNLENVSNITFNDTNVTAIITSSGNSGNFTATVTVAPGTTRGPKNATVTTPGGTFTLYSAYYVCTLPSPTGVSGSQVGLELAPYWDSTGTNKVQTPVNEGNTIYFKVTLSVSNTSYDFMGGQLAVQFPDHGTRQTPNIGNYHKTAGWGADTIGNETIPEISFNHNFVVMCPVGYVVHAADLEEYPAGSGNWVLVASASYGSYTDAQNPPRTYLNVTQLPGRQETRSALLACSAFVENPLDMYSSLQILKNVVTNGVNGLTETFHVRVSGNGTFFYHDFRLVGGIMTPGDSPWTIYNLAPGPFYVEETPDPSANWEVSGEGSITVTAQQQASKTITNTYSAPNTRITSVSAEPTIVSENGTNVTIIVHDLNNGSQNLTNNTMTLTGGFSGSPAAMDYLSGDGSPGNVNIRDYIMQPNETWVWTKTIFVNDATTFIIDGDALDENGGHVNAANGYLDEHSSVQVYKTPKVDALSTTGLLIIIVGFAGTIAYLGFQRRKQLKRL
jgi:hypothetical protein